MVDSQLLAKVCKLYQTSPSQLVPLSGGHYNAVFRYPNIQITQASTTRESSRYGILRIGVEDCPAEQTLGMLEWVSFLSERAAPVTAPIRSIEARLMEQLEHKGTAYTVTAFEAAEGTLAERIPPAEWTDELFRSIGRAAGKLHAVSKRYQPPDLALTRPKWFDSFEIHEAIRLLENTDDPARTRLQALISELNGLPAGPDDFGLIHNDLHFANFLIQPDGKVTIIDFDDCVYGWFGMDVAMALFDVLVLSAAAGEQENRDFARRFMKAYLAGYREEHQLDTYWLEQLPHFLKLKEICVYTSLLGHAEIGLPDTWVGRFMHSRLERIAQDVTYVDIDFSKL